MIFVDQMKNLRIYKKPLFLPTIEGDKKKHHAILMLTPNYESSKKIMNFPLFINKLRYQSYYLQYDVSYYISGNSSKRYDEDEYMRECTIEDMYQNLLEMTAAERKRIPDSEFGLPEKRKYPLDTEDHVRSAIRFFNYVSEEDEKELANNINRAIKRFEMTDIHVGKKNRFSKYYKPLNESADMSDLNTVLIDSLASFIRFNGYTQDVKLVTDIVDPQFYYNLLSNLQIPVKKLEDIPVLNIYVGTDYQYNSTNSDKTEEGNTVISINISIPMQGMSDYQKYVQSTIYQSVLKGLYNNCIGTILPNIASDYYCDIDSQRGKWGKILFDAEKNPLTKLEFLKACETGNIKIITDKLKDTVTVNTDDFIVNKPLEPTKESAIEEVSINNSVFNQYDVTKENGEVFGNIVMFFNEAANTNDTQLKRLLYLDRLKKRSDIILKLNTVKEEIPWIKFAYPDLHRYMARNVFVDLYYYNELFFKNNIWKMKRGFDLYLTLLKRFISNPNLSNEGYSEKTIIIPILDWNKDKRTLMYLYRNDINPISIIYELMKTESPKLKETFGKTNVLFLGRDKYFKINFSELEDIKKSSLKFRMFINKILNNEDFDLEDVDTTFDNKETPRVIKANIVDTIDINKGVDLTSRINTVDKMKAATPVKPVVSKAITKNIPEKPIAVKSAEDNMENNDVKLSQDSAPEDTEKRTKEEEELLKLAQKVAASADNSDSTEDALDYMDNDDEAKQMLADLDTIDDGGVKIDAARAARMNKLDNDFLNKNIKGQSVRDIINHNATANEIEVTELKIASPNKEWKTMRYMNFDKDYDLDSDILACIHHFSSVSKPLSVRNISVTDHSTSEDRLTLYSVDFEDFRGKRFNIKLDIPRMKDNRMLLRGNNKSLQIQMANMPIIKTDFGTCQLISNYNKIFIYRYNTSTGRSNQLTSKLLKALEKYDGNAIKVITGDNSKVCNKYELAFDYVDLAGIFDTIETPTVKIFFNQSVLRDQYQIDLSKGMPYGINKKTNEVLYYTINKEKTFIATLITWLLNVDSKFDDAFDSCKGSASGTYSRCKVYSSLIPVLVVCGYLEGLSTTLTKAGLKENEDFGITEKLTSEQRADLYINKVKFKDGYLWYKNSYISNMILNAFNDCPTEDYSITDINNKNMYFEFLDNFGGRIKADGLDNFYDCFIDPITKEILDHYKLPDDFVSMMLYGNALLCDNKYIKHTDMSSRRIRREEMIAAYTYEVLSTAYGKYAINIKHGRVADFSVKSSAVIDLILTASISSDDSIMNPLYSVETTNAITFKGKGGLNSERSYSLDKRLYDNSMLNILAGSTSHAGNVAMTRQTTMDMNVDSIRGYVKPIDGDINQLSSVKSLCATEAMIPFGCTHDDAIRTCMTFGQTAKHQVTVEDSDPLLVTSGADQAIPYLTIDKFAFKAKQDGTVKEITDDYIIVEYKDGTKDFVKLSESIEKNSDAGFYVPLKLSKAQGIKEGMKIKANTILAVDERSFSYSAGESDNITLNAGTLAKVAVINTDDGYEDAGICSESLSRKLATRVVEKVDHVVDAQAQVFKMAKIGDHVEPEEAILVWQDSFDEEEANNVMKLLSDENQDIVSELGRKTIRSEISGTIADIKIYRTVDMEKLSPSLQKIVKEYEAPIKKLKSKMESEGIDSSDLPATYKLEPTGKLKRAQDALLFEFYLEYTDTVAVGDKISYFGANKAVIKNIIPDNKVPFTDFRPNERIDAMVTQVSIDKRLVGSTILLGTVQKAMIELDRSVKDILGIKYDDTQA